MGGTDREMPALVRGVVALARWAFSLARQQPIADPVLQKSEDDKIEEIPDTDTNDFYDKTEKAISHQD